MAPVTTKGSRGFAADKRQEFGIELYNLKDDLSETNNLADAMPEKIKSMRAKIQAILDQ